MFSSSPKGFAIHYKLSFSQFVYGRISFLLLRNVPENYVSKEYYHKLNKEMSIRLHGIEIQSQLSINIVHSLFFKSFLRDWITSKCIYHLTQLSTLRVFTWKAISFCHQMTFVSTLGWNFLMKKGFRNEKWNAYSHFNWKVHKLFM